MKIFNIISLPRSGSAWLSVFLSHGRSFCFHDLLADAPVHKLFWRYINRSESVVGSVETAGYKTNFSDHFPASTQYFYIDREPGEIAESWANLGYAAVNVLEEHKKLLATAQALNARRLDYSKFYSLTYLSWLWGTVVGSGFDVERAEYLLEMNITRDVDRVLYRAKASGQL